MTGISVFVVRPRPDDRAVNYLVSVLPLGLCVSFLFFTSIRAPLRVHSRFLFAAIFVFSSHLRGFA